MTAQERINQAVTELLVKLDKIGEDEKARVDNIDRLVREQESLRDKLRAELEQNNKDYTAKKEDADKKYKEYAELVKLLEKDVAERNLTLQTIRKDEQRVKEKLGNAEFLANEAKKANDEGRKIKAEAQALKDGMESAIIRAEKEKERWELLIKEQFDKEKDLAKRFEIVHKKEMALSDYDNELHNKANELKRIEKSFRYGKSE